MKKSFGKATLGGGNKMNVHLRNYERSTHNLSKVVRTTMNVGTLVPIYTNIALNGDTFTMDINSLIKTKPAIAPLFGNYKFQVDVFQIPMRLYISALHNNSVGVGMNMSKVLTPQMVFDSNYGGKPFSSSSLMAYLGLRGIKKGKDGESQEYFGIPMLAYYDIFKNYYANKQEKTAYVISNFRSKNKIVYPTEVIYTDGNKNYTFQPTETDPNIDIWPQYGFTMKVPADVISGKWRIALGSDAQVTLNDTGTITDSTTTTTLFYTSYKLDNQTKIYEFSWQTGDSLEKLQVTFYPEQVRYIENELKLQPFLLENIDDVREKILTTPFYQKFIFGDSTYGQVLPSPYSDNFTVNNGLYSPSGKQTGLCVKTFQSDIFQNYLDSEWIEGVNGIAEITKVDTSNGLKLDDLNLAQKVYNMLNRVAVSGGSYEDWQEAVYGEDALRRAESPIYEGGMSATIAFEEVVSTADSDTAAAKNQPLGTLAGKGFQMNKKGGKIVIHAKEPALIMAIASITPLIDYSQGNKWYMSELTNLDKLHKPALDGIGFQNLPQDWLVATANSGINVGKSPAWIHYMTDVNECYGDFAMGESERFMTLQKEYEVDKNNNVSNTTTYIDPTQFNYTFADNTLGAQNFWVQVAFDIKGRRKMSAKQIPNL